MAAAPITTIIFDLSEVLLTGLFGTADRLAPLVTGTPHDVERRLHGPAFDALMTGRIFEDQYWQQLDRVAGWSLPLDVYRQIVRQNFRELEGVRSQIIDLRRRGYRLGLLSNHVREWIDHLERQFQFQQLFDDVVYSYQLGQLKPERSVYHLALRRLRADPEKTLVVDDMTKNLLSARELGCQVLQFITAHQLANDLRRLAVTS